MTSNIDSTEDPHSFPLSLRYLKSKWLNRDETREKKLQGNNSIKPEKHSSKVVIVNENLNPINDECENEIEDEIENVKENENENENGTDTENENFQPEEEYTKKSKKKKSSFFTFRSYLDKNKSQSSIKQHGPNLFTEVPGINCVPSSPLTIFADSESISNADKNILNNKNDALVNRTHYDVTYGANTINSADTYPNKSKIVLETFRPLENSKSGKKLKIVKCFPENTTDPGSDSEASSEIITASQKNINKDFKKISLIENNKSDLDGLNEAQKIVSLYVGDLDKRVRETDLHNFFSTFKGLLSVKIPVDASNAESLGYGYVNFDSQKHADNATEGLNYSVLMGSEIRIMPSLRDKSQRERLGANIFFSNLSPNLSSKTMYDRFKNLGKILSCKYNSKKRTCFINFDDKLEAYKVCKRYNRTEMDDYTIYVGVHILKKDRDNFQNKNKMIPNFAEIPTFVPSKIEQSLVIPTALTAATKTTTATTSISNDENLTNNSFVTTPEFKFMESTNASNSPTIITKTVQIKNADNGKNGQITTQFSIFMRNLPIDIEDCVIRSLVEPYGAVVSVLSRKVPSKQGAWALITLTNRESVDKAVQNLNSVEVEGKQLFVTRAIPREQKEYAKREEVYPKKKLKILISGLNVALHRSKLEALCSKFGSIKSVELYCTSQKNTDISTQDFSAYGYVEMNNEDDANKLMEILKNLGVSCFKVKIEIPTNESNFETPRYPYMLNDSASHTNPKNKLFGGQSPIPISFSYVDPTKMFQIADFNKTISVDKASILQKKDSISHKYKYKCDTGDSINLNDSNTIEMANEINKQRQNEVHEVIWELGVRLFTPIPKKNRPYQGYNKPVPKNELLSKSKVASLTDHLIKFFWANKFDEFYNFLKTNQFDENGRLLLPAHPMLNHQLIQSATYLGVIPKHYC